MIIQPLHRSRTRCLVLSALFAAGLTAAPFAHAATYVWDPIGNRSDAAGSGLWNTILPVWDSGTADVAWPNSSQDTAAFGGTDGAYTVTAASGLVASGVTFNASGYTLAGASAATPGTLNISFAGVGSGVLNVAAGKTMTIGANMTLNTGSGSYINSSNNGYTGTVVVNNGGVINFYNANIGGTFTVGANGIARDQNGSTVVNSGGTLNIDGANASFTARGLGVSSGATVNLNNGRLDVSGSFGLYMNGGTLNLNGGTYVAGPRSSANTAGSTVHLNGGLIVNGTGSYPSGVANGNTTLLVQSGGARFSIVASFDFPVGSGLLHDPAGLALDGGLVTSGGGSVTLTAAGTYNGGTTVGGGILAVTANGALGTGDASVIATSVKLTIGTGVTNPFNNVLGRLTLAGGGAAGTADNGYLDLTSGANIIVGTLTLGGTTYTSGVFGSANFPEYFSGSGLVTVVPEPSSFALVCALAVGLGGVGWRARRRTAA